MSKLCPRRKSVEATKWNASNVLKTEERFMRCIQDKCAWFVDGKSCAMPVSSHEDPGEFETLNVIVAEHKKVITKLNKEVGVRQRAVERRVEIIDDNNQKIKEQRDRIKELEEELRKRNEYPSGLREDEEN